MNWRITLSVPDLGQEEIDAVTKVIQSKWLTMGEVTQEFEKQFAEKMNVRYAFAVSNATVALHIANVALDIREGDEVLCPALTFIATANATRYTGANVVFVDSISEHDLTMDPEDIERKITPRTKAISVVHYAGFPCQMDAIMAIAEKYKLKVIEDCAHAPFGHYTFKNGTRRFVGSIGDVGCFSFFGNKNMTTGEGGMITTNDSDLAEKIKLLRSHGMTTLTYERHKGHASSYDALLLGFNYRIDEIRSAIGLCQLRKIDRINDARRNVFRQYLRVLGDNPNIIIPFARRNPEESTCHIMPVILKDHYGAIKEKLKNAGIQTSKHYELIPSFTYYRSHPFQSKIDLIQNILTLPMHSDLKPDDIEFIGQTMQL